MSHKHLVKILRDAGLTLPPPVERFLDKEPVVFALDTRKRLRSWTLEHGYSDTQNKVLKSAIGRIAIHRRYLRHVADGVIRVDLNGNQTEAPDADAIAYAADRLATLKSKPKSAGNAPEAAKMPDTTSSTTASPASSGTAPAAVPASTAKRPVLKIGGLAKRPASTKPAAPRTTRLSSPPLPAVYGAPGRAQTKPRVSLLPAALVREVVELINNRRGSIRLIKAFKTNSAAIANERKAWIADATRRLAADGAGDTGGVDGQVTEAVDDMLITVVPKAARQNIER